MKIYLIGSLRNPEVPKLGNELRYLGFDVFDDWYASSEDADDWLLQYEKDKGHTYTEALSSYAARHIFALDIKHLQTADVGVLLLPAGKSCHLEAGWLLGRGRPVFIVFPEEPTDRLDVMYQLATGVCIGTDTLIAILKENHD